MTELLSALQYGLSLNDEQIKKFIDSNYFKAITFSEYFEIKQYRDTDLEKYSKMLFDLMILLHSENEHLNLIRRHCEYYAESDEKLDLAFLKKMHTYYKNYDSKNLQSISNRILITYVLVQLPHEIKKMIRKIIKTQNSSKEKTFNLAVPENILIKHFKNLMGKVFINEQDESKFILVFSNSTINEPILVKSKSHLAYYLKLLCDYQLISKKFGKISNDGKIFTDGKSIINQKMITDALSNIKREVTKLDDDYTAMDDAVKDLRNSV